MMNMVYMLVVALLRVDVIYITYLNLMGEKPTPRDRRAMGVLAALMMDFGIYINFGYLSGFDEIYFLICLVVPVLMIQPNVMVWMMYPCITMWASVLVMSLNFLLTSVAPAGMEFLCNPLIHVVLIVCLHIFQERNPDKGLDTSVPNYVLYLVSAIVMYITTLVCDLYAGNAGGADVYPMFIMVSISATVFTLTVLWQGVVSQEKDLLRRQKIADAALLTMQENQITDLVATNENMRRLRHDIRNHMNILSGLARNKDDDALLDYINSVEKDMTVPTHTDYTGNQIIDGVLSKNVFDAQEKGITCELTCQYASGDRTLTYDLSIIINNLFSNAIEACEKIGDGDKIIRIKLASYNEFTMFQIRNTTAGEVKVTEVMPTTKSDPEQHGIGLMSVRQSVRRHNGTLALDWKDGWFIADVMI